MCRNSTKRLRRSLSRRHLMNPSRNSSRMTRAVARTICMMQGGSCKPLTRGITLRSRMVQPRVLKVHRQRLCCNKLHILVAHLIRRRLDTHRRPPLAYIPEHRPVPHRSLSMEHLLPTPPHQAIPVRSNNMDNLRTSWHNTTHLSILLLSRAHIHFLTITRPHKALTHKALTPRARI